MARSVVLKYLYREKNISLRYDAMMGSLLFVPYLCINGEIYV